MRRLFHLTEIRRPEDVIEHLAEGERHWRKGYSKWYWPGEGTKVYLQLRYGNKPLEVKKGKPAIELEDIEALLPTLNQIRDAIVAGEFDTVLMAAKKERALGWTRPKK